MDSIYARSVPVSGSKAFDTITEMNAFEQQRADEYRARMEALRQIL